MLALIKPGRIHAVSCDREKPKNPAAFFWLLARLAGLSPHPYLWQICLLQPARRRPTAAAQGSVTINMAAGSVGEPPHSLWHPTQPQPQPHPLQPLKPTPPHWPLLPARVYYTPAWCYLRFLPSPPRVPGVSPSPLLLCYYFLPDLLTPSSPPRSPHFTILAPGTDDLHRSQVSPTTRMYRDAFFTSTKHT